MSQSSAVKTLQPEAPQIPLSEHAYRQLRAAILRGVLEPASRLKMETLQQISGLSNSPLREALSRLAMEGLVLALDNRGFRVAPVSLADLRDLTEMRLLLERQALVASMEQGGDAWESAAVAAFHRLELTEQRISTQKLALNDEWTDRHRDFHLALLDGGQSTRLKAQLAVLFDQAERYRRLSAAHRSEPRQKSTEHRRLLDLALARVPGPACAALEEHVRRTADNVERVLGKVIALPTSR